MKDGLIIDLFAGGGGASVGIEMALGREVDIAINHDPQAIRMHKTNHPNTLHLTEDVFKVYLKKIVGDRHVALVWASPDCTSHSKAKGGQPRNKGLRILPWAVFKHARLIKPDVIIMENVEEIQQWGPLDENGHPIKARMGESYNQFMDAMESLGYVVESRELIAANYGAPTTRNVGMRFLEGMESLLSGPLLHTLRTVHLSGLNAVTTSTGLTLARAFLTVRNLLQKLPRSVLLTALRSTSSTILILTSSRTRMLLLTSSSITVSRRKAIAEVNFLVSLSRLLILAIVTVLLLLSSPSFIRLALVRVVLNRFTRLQHRLVTSDSSVPFWLNITELVVVKNLILLWLLSRQRTDLDL